MSVATNVPNVGSSGDTCASYPYFFHLLILSILISASIFPGKLHKLVSVPSNYLSTPRSDFYFSVKRVELLDEGFMAKS